MDLFWKRIGLCECVVYVFRCDNGVWNVYYAYHHQMLVVVVVVVVLVLVLVLVQSRRPIPL